MDATMKRIERLGWIVLALIGAQVIGMALPSTSPIRRAVALYSEWRLPSEVGIAGVSIPIDRTLGAVEVSSGEVLIGHAPSPQARSDGALLAIRATGMAALVRVYGDSSACAQGRCRDWKSWDETIEGVPVLCASHLTGAAVVTRRVFCVVKGRDAGVTYLGSQAQWPRFEPQLRTALAKLGYGGS